MTDVIVVGSRGGSVGTGNYNSTGGGQQQAQAQLGGLATYYGGKDDVKSEPDVEGEDVQVIGKRLKEIMGQGVAHSAHAGGQVVELPCVGSTNMREITSILDNMAVTMTNRNFGSGRAGAMNVGGSSGPKNVRIDVNIDAVRGYDPAAAAAEPTVPSGRTGPIAASPLAPYPKPSEEHR